MEIKRDHINFAVGPVQMAPQITALGALPVPYFRTPDFSAVMLQSEQLLLQLMGAPQQSRAVFLTGSGTAAMEAAVTGLFTPRDRLLIVNGGSFGARFCQICQLHGIPFEAILLPAGAALKPQHLASYEGGSFTGFLVNMDETSTGVLYDMIMISDFCRRNNLALVVDAVSSFLCDPLDMAQLGADVILTGSQKALAVPPGVSMLALSPRAIGRIESHPPVCYYLDLRAALKNGERGQTPFTPAVGILLQLNARLNQIAQDGLEAEIAKMAAAAAEFRRRIAPLPLRIASESLSNAVTPLSPTDSSVRAYRIFEVLKEEYNIIVCPNGGELADKLFRVGHLGNLSASDYDALLSALHDLVRRGILR